LADIGKPEPERDAMIALYRRMPQLPPQLQMFLRGCPPEREDLRHRWNCRDIVVRNLLALAGGVRRTLCWNLGPEFAGELEPYRGDVDNGTVSLPVSLTPVFVDREVQTVDSMSLV
jgi:hypothetical protein